jgi:hypothetical protein
LGCSFLKNGTKKLLPIEPGVCLGIHLNEEKFFASFFQKRRPCLAFFSALKG